MQLLKGKVAVITGSTRGIGFEIAKEFAGRGAEVVLCSRNLASAQKAAGQIEGKVYAEQLDVTDQKSVKAFVQRRRHIDILVNNAGYPFERRIWYKKFHEVAEQDFGSIIDVDLKGTLRMSQAAIPLMAKAGSGVIINISSTPALAGHTEGAPYTVAKAGIIAVTKHIATEYGGKNIRAYTLALGNIATDATYGTMTAQERKKAAAENAMKRWGKPGEVARVAASLASDDFSFATGNTIVIDGGTVLW